SVDLDDLAARTSPSVGVPATPASGVAVESTGGVHEVLTAAWGELLGVSPIGPDDDFFELGGHSLIAIRLMSRIHKSLGVRLQLATLFEASTIARLAEVILAERPELALAAAVVADEHIANGAAGRDGGASTAGERARHPSVVPIRTTGSGRPFFIVHGAGGNVLNLWALVKHLPEDRPVYGLQAHGIDGRDAPDPNLEAMARRYVEGIRSVQPEGPYLLGGYSGGGVVALEMTSQLAAVGQRVPRIVMFDTVPRLSDFPARGKRMINVASNALRKGPAAMAPWLGRYRAIRRGEIEIDLEQFGLGFGDTAADMGFVNLTSHFAELIEAYRFTSYDVDVLIAKAEKVYPEWPWHYGWRPYITGRIDVVISPGDHFEMFSTENAPVLAARIRPYLEAADRD
ncbi:MAG TPA: thioesterase domain-containing protein, partial [Acidimicrobiales bacterium]|nr:thioesterase domain-containing protein [Acidimicrobiales bacterium]